MGRTGNNMFQYAAARILADVNGLKLGTEWIHNDFLEATEQYGDIFETYPINILDISKENKNHTWHLNEYHESSVRMKGFFQYPEVYDANKEIVRRRIDGGNFDKTFQIGQKIQLPFDSSE